MKGFKKGVSILLIAVFLFCSAGVTAGQWILPDQMEMSADREPDFGSLYSVRQRHQPAAANTADTENESEYEAEVKFLGLIPVKSVKVNIKDRKTVAVCGSVIGLRIYSDGISVVDLDSVTTVSGLKKPAFDAGFMKGDVIVAVDGQPVFSSQDVTAAVSKAGGQALVFTVRRGEESLQLTLTPALDSTTGAYRAGLWLRDSAAGIGTMTFYDPETMCFASLGHPVSDQDTGLTVQVRKGDILTASINSVRKSGSGTAGELSGTFTDRVLGEIYENGERGIYGVLTASPAVYGIFPVAGKEEVQPGEAQIITSIDNSGPKAYDMVIESCEADDTGNKNMVIRITDTSLLAVTGGIVQGMSGSPIIQNGKLVGAVTHVLLDDPARGYAIYAQNMMKSVQQTEQQMNQAS